MDKVGIFWMKYGDFFKNILWTYEESDLNDWLNEWVIVGMYARSNKENIEKKYT